MKYGLGHTNVAPVLTQIPSNVSTPRGWRWARLVDIARLESGHTPSRYRSDYWGGHIPWLSLKDIKSLNGRYVYDTVDHPTQLGIDNSSARVLPKNTVAFCRTASVGKTVILGREMATSQDFVNWVCGPDVHPEYLYFALKHSSPTFNKEKQGTTHQTIYMPTVERFKLLLPPLAEQKLIADILDRADSVRSKQDESHKLASLLPYSLFHETFLRGGNECDLFPLSDVAEVVSGVAKGRHLNGSDIREAPYLRVANVQAGFLNLTEVKTIAATQKEVNELRLQRGDVVMTEGGDFDKLGRGALWDESIPDCIHQNHVFRVRPNRKRMLPSFFVHYLQTQRAKGYFLQCAKKTTNLASINMRQLRALPVPLPPVDKQLRFERELKSVHHIVGVHCERVVESKHLFDSLVHRAFRGEL